MQRRVCLPFAGWTQGLEMSFQGEAGLFVEFTDRSVQRGFFIPNSPFGMVQQPASLFFQKGPPGWTRKTSNEPATLL